MPPSSVLVQKDATVVFENSPKQTLADVKHELIPEISVASKILTQPETKVKLREVSSRLKEEDAKYKGRFSLPTAYSTPRASVSSSPSVTEIIVDAAPSAGFKRKQELWGSRSPNGSPVQQRIRRDTEQTPFLSSSLTFAEYESTAELTRHTHISQELSLLSKIKKFLCCEDSP